jgi:hypothetical protein
VRRQGALWLGRPLNRQIGRDVVAAPPLEESHEIAQDRLLVAQLEAESSTQSQIILQGRRQ